jgi:hypothetical protein
LKGIDTLVDKVRNAVGKYTCFTGAGACYNHKRTIHMGRSSALRIVEFGKEIRFCIHLAKVQGAGVKKFRRI